MTFTDFGTMFPGLLCITVAIFTVESDYLISCMVFYTIRREEHYSVTSFDKLNFQYMVFETNHNAVTRENLKNNQIQNSSR